MGFDVPAAQFETPLLQHPSANNCCHGRTVPFSGSQTSTCPYPHPTQPPGHSVTLPAPVAVPVDKSTPRWSPRDPTKAICSPTQPHSTSLQSTFSDHPQHMSTPEQGITFGRPSGLYKLLPLMLEVSELAAGGHLHLYRDPDCLATSLSLPINSNTLQPPPVVPGTISV